jgi:uncharacterized protein YbjQ (UPF0145 family)
MRCFTAIFSCLMLVACAREGRPAATGGEEHEGAVDDDHDHDEKIPDDPVTVAKAAKVKVLQGDDIGCPAEALGPVDVHKKMESTSQALEALKRRAAALDADAVVHVDFEHGEGGKEPTHLSGMAVRCNDLLKGRDYDVIGKLEVNGDMGGEERAFAKLLGKASAMKADLVINVEFEHGEGGEGEPTKVRGTAIKFTSGPKR